MHVLSIDTTHTSCLPNQKGVGTINQCVLDASSNKRKAISHAKCPKSF